MYSYTQTITPSMSEQFDWNKSSPAFIVDHNGGFELTYNKPHPPRNENDLQAWMTQANKPTKGCVLEYAHYIYGDQKNAFGFELALSYSEDEQLSPLVNIRWVFASYASMQTAAEEVTERIRSGVWYTLIPSILAFNVRADQEDLPSEQRANFRSKAFFDRPAVINYDQT